MQLFLKYKILTMYFILFILFQITFSQHLKPNPPPIRYIIKTNLFNNSLQPQTQPITSIRQNAFQTVKNGIISPQPQPVKQLNQSKVVRANSTSQQTKKNIRQGSYSVIASSKNRVVDLHKIYQIAEIGDIEGIQEAVERSSSFQKQKCFGKIEYLCQIVEIVEMTKKIKKTELKTSQNKIDFAEYQGKQIENRIKKLENDRKQLQLYSKNFSISLILDDIQLTKKKQIQVKQEIQNQQIQILQMQHQIQKITKFNQIQKQQLQIKKKNLTNTNAYISDLQSRLEKAQQERNQLKLNISKRELSIKQRNQLYKWKSWLISYINSSIPVLYKYLYKYTQQSYIIEVDLQRTRTEIIASKIRDKKLLEDIHALEQSISAKNKILYFSERLQQIRNLTLKLTDIDKFVKNYIDNMADKCKERLVIDSGFAEDTIYNNNYCLSNQRQQLKTGQILEVLGYYIFKVQADDQAIVTLKPDEKCFSKSSVNISPEVGQWILWKGTVIDSIKQQYRMKYVLIV